MCSAALEIPFIPLNKYLYISLDRQIARQKRGKYLWKIVLHDFG